MNTGLVFVLLLTYSTATPVAPVIDDELDRGLAGWAASAWNMGTNMGYNVIAGGLNMAGRMAPNSTWVTALNNTVLATLAAGGRMSVWTLKTVVSGTVTLATTSEIIPEDLADRISVTFGVSTDESVQPLTADDIEQMELPIVTVAEGSESFELVNAEANLEENEKFESPENNPEATETQPNSEETDEEFDDASNSEEFQDAVPYSKWDAGVIGNAQEDFRSTLQMILHAQQNGGSQMEVLNSLQAALLDLLAAHAGVGSKRQLEKYNYFGVPTLVSEVKSIALGTSAAVAKMIKVVAPQVDGPMTAVKSFLVDLKNQAEAKLKQASQVPLNLARNTAYSTVSSTMDLAVTKHLFDEETKQALLATFGGNSEASGKVLTEKDVSGLVIEWNVDATNDFKQTLVSLIHLKSNNVSEIVLLSGLEAILLDLLRANKIIRSTGVDAIREVLNLPPAAKYAWDAAELVLKFGFLKAVNAPYQSYAITLAGFTNKRLENGVTVDDQTLTFFVNGLVTLARSTNVITGHDAGVITSSLGIPQYGMGGLLKPGQTAHYLIRGADAVSDPEVRESLKDLANVATGKQSEATIPALKKLCGTLTNMLYKSGVINQLALGGLQTYFAAKMG